MRIFTEKEKIRIEELRKSRMELYNTLSIEQRIDVVEFGYEYSMRNNNFEMGEKHMFIYIKLLIDKIRDRHCSS